MYTHALWATRPRREHLRTTKYFECHCQRCIDPTELGSHLGTLKCLCGSGLVLPNDPLDTEADWSCTVCPGILSASQVIELTERIADDVEAAMSIAKQDSLRDLLSRYFSLKFIRIKILHFKFCEKNSGNQALRNSSKFFVTLL